MKDKTSTPSVSTYRLTIGTPYGAVEVDLAVCGDHFAFHFLNKPVALSTRAAEPFLYRLLNTLPFIGEAMWMDFPPEDVRAEIESNIYRPDNFAFHESGLN